MNQKKKLYYFQVLVSGYRYGARTVGLRIPAVRHVLSYRYFKVLNLIYISKYLNLGTSKYFEVLYEVLFKIPKVINRLQLY